MNTCPRCSAELVHGTQFCPGCGAPVPAEPADDLMASSASDPTGLLDRLREALAGEFKIIRELGRGGMSRVYLAQEVALERRVALKVLPPQLAEQEQVVRRFQREARMVGKLSHPHIVPVYQVSERSGLYFFTMPYVAGPSLRQVLRRQTALSVELCRRYLREAADALNYAHSHGVIHRDVKPENMLLEGSRDGRLLVTDFGIAKAMGAGLTTLTRPGDLMGTPYFMSPEQCNEREKIDGRSDQYSLGLVGYEMLAGRFPLAADSLAGIVYKHLHEYPEPLAQVRPEVPDDLRRAIERAIRKNPDERFPTMGHMLAALGKPGRGGPGAAPRGSGARRFAKGRRAALAAAAALALGVAGLAVWVGDDVMTLWGGGADRTEPAMEGERVAETNGEPAMMADSVATTAAEASPGGVAGGTDIAPTPAAQDEVQQPSGSEGGEPGVAAAPGGADAERAARRRGAEQAREAARLALAMARSLGADTLFGAEFKALLNRYAQADSELAAARYTTAATGFAAVGAGFERLISEADRTSRELADRLGPAEEARAAELGGDTLPAEVVADSLAGERRAESPAEALEDRPPEVTASAEEMLTDLVESYRQAVEAEDLERLSQAVYRAPIPADDIEMLRRWFRAASHLKVRVQIEELNVNAVSAQARIRQQMEYRLERTGDRREFELELRFFFTRKPDGWRLDRFEL